METEGVAVVPGPEERRDFLAGQPPFDSLPADLLMLVAETAAVRDAADGETLLGPEDGPPKGLFVIAAGRVSLEAGDDEPADLFVGESFPIEAVTERRAVAHTYRASGAVRLYRVPAAVIVQCIDSVPEFAAFCRRSATGLLVRGQAENRRQAGDELSRITSLDVSLRSVCAHTPVTAGADEDVRRVVARMHREGVGSVLVVNAGGGLLGIFTLHDLRRVVADGGSLEARVDGVMSADPRTLPADALAFEAVILMAQHHIRHIPVMDGERIVGVVSERDLFARQRVNVVQVMRALNNAVDVAGIVAVRADIPPLIDALLGHGAGVDQITRVLTLLNDRTVARVIELCVGAHGEPAAPFTWMAFGSEGRGEQTLHTDQDNGMLFDPGARPADEVREALLPLAREINEALDRCGFDLCKGNIMASNPELCLSLQEWRRLFSRMIASATPENLLRSSIYFDLRTVWGDVQPVEQLRGHILAEVRDNTLFLRSLAGNALTHRPALGWLRTFATERGRDGATFDIKMRGLFPFVEGARVLALESGIEATGTAARLAALPEAGVCTPDEAEAWGHALDYLQLIRMRAHQAQTRAGEALSNRVAPGELNPLDQRVLREALRQGRDIQRRLAVRFQL
ncbi:DUF294 nucleotidyltransferase-like domain-containing protein [Arhodomonas aquaeolei]|uniref:DUF294 nucleotidyltransferase-like domain-containing protein n=1 Tax=Arhodomonas aquaeolei TaxID=2369 RepID=UPI0003682563|nr:DUF294 nucleotidyltransferase-like domain-containing protein [Arhodomonas aquaeolei]